MVKRGPASSDMQLMKGQEPQFCKGLIAPTKNNHVLVGQSFHNVNSEDEAFKNHTLQPGDFICWKSTSKRTLFNLTGKAPVKYSSPVFVPPNSKQ